MSEYLVDCHKCTNKSINAKGEEFCIPISQHKQGIHIVDGTCGNEFVFDCDEYTEDERKTVIRLY